MSYHGKDKLDEKGSTCTAGKLHNNPCGICSISPNLMYWKPFAGFLNSSVAKGMLYKIAQDARKAALQHYKMLCLLLACSWNF